MDTHELTEKIKRFALEETRFDLVGIARARLPELHESAIESWLAKGYQGTMDYLERDGAKRAHPESSLPEALSVISLAINYHHPDDPKPEGIRVGKVAKYAYGRDYHKVISKKLKTLAAYIEEIGGETAKTRVYVDTGPILEKAFAKESGIGFFGKNTNIITRGFGSWVFLASVITNLELRADEPHLGSCGSCRLCIDACPTGALLGDYQMDARKCISYLTIESKESIPEILKPKLSGWAFGCDICQDVCPYNFRAKTTQHEDLFPRKIAGTWIDLEEIKAMKEGGSFLEKFAGSPVMRTKLAGLQKSSEALLSVGKS